MDKIEEFDTDTRVNLVNLYLDQETDYSINVTPCSLGEAIRITASLFSGDFSSYMKGLTIGLQDRQLNVSMNKVQKLFLHANGTVSEEIKPGLYEVSYNGSSTHIYAEAEVLAVAKLAIELEHKKFLGHPISGTTVKFIRKSA